MKLETASKTLHRHGWVDIPTQDEADKMLACLSDTGWVCQDGSYVTREERTALRAIAAGDTRHRGYIDGLTVRSDARYVVCGSVRGLVGEHRTLAAARRTQARDQRGCKSQRGYSDAYVYEWADGQWSLVPSEDQY